VPWLKSLIKTIYIPQFSQGLDTIHDFFLKTGTIKTTVMLSFLLFLLVVGKYKKYLWSINFYFYFEYLVLPSQALPVLLLIVWSYKIFQEIGIYILDYKFFPYMRKYDIAKYLNLYNKCKKTPQKNVIFPKWQKRNIMIVGMFYKETVLIPFVSCACTHLGTLTWWLKLSVLLFMY